MCRWVCSGTVHPPRKIFFFLVVMNRHQKIRHNFNLTVCHLSFKSWKMLTTNKSFLLFEIHNVTRHFEIHDRPLYFMLEVLFSVVCLECVGCSRVQWSINCLSTLDYLYKSLVQSIIFFDLCPINLLFCLWIIIFYELVLLDFRFLAWSEFKRIAPTTLDVLELWKNNFIALWIVNL